MINFDILELKNIDVIFEKLLFINIFNNNLPIIVLYNIFNNLFSLTSIVCLVLRLYIFVIIRIIIRMIRLMQILQKYKSKYFLVF